MNDPIAEPYNDVTDVAVANDPRRHRAGDTLDTALPFGSHTGYRWGATQDFKTLGLWLGVLLCLAAAALAALARRRALLWGSRVALLAGVALLVAVTPVV